NLRNPVVPISAAVLAVVATQTQPKYSPNVPSVTSLSVGRVEILADSNLMRCTNTANKAMITISLANTLPACTTPIHAAFNRADRLTHARSGSWRADARWAGSSW